ncbi:uncharacterized protein [Procambarus clarkii]|uniref:uncharacterized protein isoform X9 n=1 Tax=Procambarus clarkii TaxID=6728 RepID=UPI0037421714
MGWTTKLLIFSLIGLAACQQRSISGGGRRRQRVQASKTEAAAFNCPQDFGYYPHPTDCTQYFVCVFGGALQESCTGGLVYSHELETCDWPRNVDCNPSKTSSGISTVKVTDPRTQSTSPIRPSTEALTPSVGESQDLHSRTFLPSSSFDARFDHTFSSSQTHRTARPFDGGDRSNNQRALFLQESSPKQALVSPQFSQQAFFDTPAVQQTSRRAQLRAKPATFSPHVFQATTQAPAPPAPQVDETLYADLNLTDHDYLYYYDDLLYDYYETASPAPAATQATRVPAQRQQGTHTPQRNAKTQAFEFSDFDFDSASPISSFSFSGVTDLEPTTPEPVRFPPTFPPAPLRQHQQSHNNGRAGAGLQSAQRSHSSSSSRSHSSAFSQSQTSAVSQSQPSAFSQSQPSAIPQGSLSPHFARIPAIGSTKKIQTQSQEGSFTQSASQALRALSNIATDFPETFPGLQNETPTRDSPSPSPSRNSNARSSQISQTVPTSSSSSGSSSSAKSPSRSNTRQSSSSSQPSRESSSPSVAAVDSSVPKRNRRPSLKPVSVIAPSAPISKDIWRYPPRRPAPVGPTPPVDTKATKCDPKLCRLPDCYCGGREIPAGFQPAETPQIVLLTFDDSVNDLNKELYIDLFEKGRVNPNGCPIVSTMYVSHEWTDYSQVQNLYADGHEIASHSIQHSFGEQFSTKKWAKEIAGQREILSAYGGVKMEDVRGMRAPFLAVGGNKMYRMLWQENFTYDSSMPVYENTPPSWPYTLDYRIFHDCMIPPCPTNSFPGLWQVPMVMWVDLNGGRCSMGDACTTPPDAEGVYKMLIKNFERHYTSNRAPFGLFYHAAWFTTPHHKEGFIAFLDTITAMDDVWLTTNWQLIQWMRDPTPLSRIKNFAPFSCNYSDRPKCTSKKVCNVWHKGGVRYMRTCQVCPETYPWTGNTGVDSPLNEP